MLRTTRAKLMIVVEGLLAGAVLLWLWGRPGASLSALLGAVGGFAVAVVWGIEYAIMTGRLGVGTNSRIEAIDCAAKEISR